MNGMVFLKNLALCSVATRNNMEWTLNEKAQT